MIIQCPFFSGNPCQTTINGQSEPLHRIIGRVLRGKSTAMIGEPHTGKTSLLLYLAAAQTRATLYGDKLRPLLFASLDAETFEELHPSAVLGTGASACQGDSGGCRSWWPSGGAV